MYDVNVPKEIRTLMANIGEEGVKGLKYGHDFSSRLSSFNISQVYVYCSQEPDSQMEEQLN